MRIEQFLKSSETIQKIIPQVSEKRGPLAPFGYATGSSCHRSSTSVYWVNLYKSFDCMFFWYRTGYVSIFQCSRENVCKNSYNLRVSFGYSKNVKAYVVLETVSAAWVSQQLSAAHQHIIDCSAMKSWLTVTMKAYNNTNDKSLG